jgi:Rad3-related DNA helicase
MSILNHVPAGFVLRPHQVQALQEVERHWPTSEVIILDSPVGFGKSLAAMTISNWQNSLGKTVAVTTPRVALQEQYLRDWPTLPNLKGMAHYQCKDLQTDCGTAMELLGEKCSNCVYTKAKKEVIQAPTALFNVHSCIFLLNQRRKERILPKDVIVVDEAHTLFDVLSGMYEINLWKHIEKYEGDMITVSDVYAFLETRVVQLEKEMNLLYMGTHKDKIKAAAKKTQMDKFYRVMDGIAKSPSNFFIQKDKALYHGKMKEVLKVRPLDLNGLPPLLWSNKQKIVLMTGTWNEQDMKMLGLDRKRHAYIHCPNPIPAERRPIIIPQGLNMSKEFQDKNLKDMAILIDTLKDKYNSKGIVHMTYDLAVKIAPYLKDPCYLYHTPDTASEVLDKFLASKEKVVMIACGMTTGLDLVGEDYQWQAIAKIPYPSLGDPLIKKWLRDTPDWYKWLSVRQVLQASGRICRGPQDYGATYVLDNTIGNLTTRYGLLRRAGDMIPQYFKDAIIFKEVV